MLARCSRCQATFPVERSGRQVCPNCHVEVIVRDPEALLAAEPATNAWGEPEKPAETPAEPIAWERRAELGFATALWRTLRGVLVEPGRFFARADWKEAPGVHLWVLLVAGLPAMVNLLVETASLEQMLGKARELGLGDIVAGTEATMQRLHVWPPSVSGFLAMAFATLFLLFSMLYVGAAMSHATLLATGRARGGWNATFKAFAYGATPLVLLVIPSCGPFIGLIWSGLLDIRLLAKAHGISETWAAVAVVVPSTLLFCCVGMVPLMFMAQAASQLP